MPGNRNRAGVGVVYQMWPCALVPSVCVPLCLVAVTLETRACTWDLWHLIVDILHAGTAQTREGWHGISLSCKQTNKQTNTQGLDSGHQHMT